MILHKFGEKKVYFLSGSARVTELRMMTVIEHCYTNWNHCCPHNTIEILYESFDIKGHQTCSPRQPDTHGDQNIHIIIVERLPK